MCRIWRETGDCCVDLRVHSLCYLLLLLLIFHSVHSPWSLIWVTASRLLLTFFQTLWLPQAVEQESMPQMVFHCRFSLFVSFSPFFSLSSTTTAADFSSSLSTSSSSSPPPPHSASSSPSSSPSSASSSSSSSPVEAPPSLPLLPLLLSPLCLPFSFLFIRSYRSILHEFNHHSQQMDHVWCRSNDAWTLSHDCRFVFLLRLFFPLLPSLDRSLLRLSFPNITLKREWLGLFCPRCTATSRMLRQFIIWNSETNRKRSSSCSLCSSCCLLLYSAIWQSVQTCLQLHCSMRSNTLN